MSHLNNLDKSVRSIILVVCIILLYAGPSMAQSIAAQLHQKKPDRAVVEIVLKRPASGNLIVELQFPPHLNVQGVTPDAAKIDKDRGMLKWLIKNAKPGKLRLQTDFSKPFEKKDISGFIRFRASREGTLVEIEADWQ